MIPFLRLALLFFIYAFLGWCTEVAFAACKEGRFVNRGFLNGPVCPIYGFGVVGVALALRPVMDSLPLLFLGSVVITSLIEFVTGFVLEKVFHAKWWDYSGMPLNIMGYVCLLFSLIWGVACTVIMKLVYPPIEHLVYGLPKPLLIVLVCVFFAVLAVDLAATLATIRKLNERLKRLTELAAEIHSVSDEIGKAISDTTLAAKQKAEAGEERWNDYRSQVEEKLDQSRTAREQRSAAMRDRIEQGREAGAQRLAALKESFSNMLEERSFGQKRLMNAFPHLKSSEHQAALEALREKYAQLRAGKKK